MEIVSLNACVPSVRAYMDDLFVLAATAEHIAHCLTTSRKNCKYTIFPIIDRGRNSTFPSGLVDLLESYCDAHLFIPPDVNKLSKRFEQFSGCDAIGDLRSVRRKMERDKIRRD